MRIKAKEIAQELGLSEATVSLALFKRNQLPSLSAVSAVLTITTTLHVQIQRGG